MVRDITRLPASRIIIMRSALLRAAALLALASSSALAAPLQVAAVPAARLDTAVFAGGCFWGVQAVFQHVKGVVSATSGYAGGTVASPGYEAVTTGRTGHAEAVRVVFDPSTVSYTTLLDVFFTVAHNPTELNRQGPDVGTQYRSALFFTNPAQHAVAAKFVSMLDKSGRHKRPIVTQISSLRTFYPAEAYHQDYATRNPQAPYIVYHDAPKLEALKREYSALWTDKLATSAMR